MLENRGIASSVSVTMIGTIPDFALIVLLPGEVSAPNKPKQNREPIKLVPCNYVELPAENPAARLPLQGRSPRLAPEN